MKQKYLSLQGDMTAGNTHVAGGPDHPPHLACLLLGNQQDISEQEEGELIPLPTEHVFGSNFDTVVPTHKTKNEHSDDWSSITFLGF